MENSSCSHLFISQIDIVFNKENLREFYTSSSCKMKRLNLIKTIVQKLTNNYHSNDSNDSFEDLNESEIEEDAESTNEELIHSPRPHDKGFKTLFHMKCENAINLIHSVRSFIFSSCNYQIENEENAFCDLVDFLTEGMDDK
jgi:non-homologous end joining protein Ku